MKGRPRPEVLPVIQALFSLSPKAYAPLARMIVSCAQAEAIRDQRQEVFRNNRRLLKERASAAKSSAPSSDVITNCASSSSDGVTNRAFPVDATINGQAPVDWGAIASPIVRPGVTLWRRLGGGGHEESLVIPRLRLIAQSRNAFSRKTYFAKNGPGNDSAA